MKAGIMKTFNDIGVSQKLIDTLKKQGIEKPTPIQEKSISLIKYKKDVIAEAQTGTGKTLAFLLPIFDQIDTTSELTQALIVTPTRELAIQITQEAKKLNPEQTVNTLAVYGGQDIRAQLHKLKGGVHLVIATPGRIIDHIKRQTINLSHLKTLVLDEADQMLHIGFKNEMEFIIGQTPKSRQTLCFSATMNSDVNKLAYKHMKDPSVVVVEKKEITLKNIKQYLIRTTDRNKQHDFMKLTKQENPFMAIIFCRTKRRVDKLEEALFKAGYNCNRLHGGMTQSQREKVMKAFKASEIQYLIATDVAARGLDISGVSHVYNYDIPENAEGYIHRIGRTGRAGKHGITYLFVAEKDKSILKEIEQSIKKRIPLKHVDPIQLNDGDHLFSGDDLLNPDGSHKNKVHAVKVKSKKKTKAKTFDTTEKTTSSDHNKTPSKTKSKSVRKSSLNKHKKKRKKPSN